MVVHTLASTVFVGSALELNTGTGLAQNATGAGTTFCGFALQGGQAGDRPEIADSGDIELTVAKATNWAANDVASAPLVYLTDGNTFTLTSAGGQPIGKVVEILSGISTTSAVVVVHFESAAKTSK